ncbi:MAG: fumarylacetoacetate hydrolase family protein, partial [Rhabdochlamydiaceae bacterium]
GVLGMSANTGDMICSVPMLIRYLSGVLTLRPGDIITTGTPPGSNKLDDGAVLRGWVEGIGEMNLNYRVAKSLD